jgi:hypothetical protein
MCLESRPRNTKSNYAYLCLLSDLCTGSIRGTVTALPTVLCSRRHRDWSSGKSDVGKRPKEGKRGEKRKKKHATIKEKSDETIRDAYRAELVTFERVVQSMANQDADRQSVLGLAPLTQPCVVFGNVVRPGPAHRCIII